MSDPRHFDTILPFLQPGDVGHKIDLTVDDIAKMLAASASCISAPTTAIQTRSRGSSSLVPVSSTLTPSSDLGENVPLPDQGEQGIIQTSESSDRTARIADMVDNLLRENDLTLKQHKAFKQAENVPPAAVIQYLKPTLLAKILVYHKHVLTLPCSFLQVDNTDKEDLKLMARRAYAIKGFPYIDYEVRAPKQMQEEYKGSPIRINAERIAKIHSAVTELSPNISEKDDRRKKLEAQVTALRASECASKAIAMVQERRKAELTLQKEMTLSGHLTQIIDTFPEKSCSIWDEIDLLEGSPLNHGTVMCNLKFKPF